MSCATGGGESGRGAAPSGPEPRAATAHVRASPAAEPDRGQAEVVLLPPGHPSVSVPVEVASRPAERRRGLMHRRQLDPQAGMLFLFEHPAQQSFWMRNTYIPLDMIFIRSDLSVLGVVENAEPLTDDSRAVPGLSQYVLEVNAGFARKHGVAAGTLVRFEDLPDRE